MEKEQERFAKLKEEKTQLETQLEEKMDRWTYLEELAAKILQQNA